VGNNTGDGNRAISSRVCPATSGKNASTNALASAGVLYIFQLALSMLYETFGRFLNSILVDGFQHSGDGGHNGEIAASGQRQQVSGQSFVRTVH